MDPTEAETNIYAVFYCFRTGEERSLAKYLEVVAICRSLRWSWQNTEAALLQLSVFHVLRASLLVPPPATDSVLALVSPTRLVLPTATESVLALVSPAQLMLLLSLLLDRLVQLAEKFYLFVLVTTTSVENRCTRQGWGNRCTRQGWGNLNQNKRVRAPAPLFSLLPR